MVTKVADIAEYVKRQFGDEAGVQITDQDILRWVNAAQRELNARNEILRGVGSTDLTAGVTEYDISSIDMLKIHSLYVNGKPIEHRSFQAAEEYIISQDPNRVSTGEPRVWWKWGNTLGFWPKPDASVTDGIKIYFISAPNNIDDINGTLEIPDDYYNRVIEYVMAQAYELDEDSDSSRVKLDQFSDGLSRMAGQHDRTAIETYSTVTVLPEDAW